MDLDLWQHLAELRRRLMISAPALSLGFLLSLPLSKSLLALLMARAGRLVFLRPAQSFMVHLKLAGQRERG